MLPRLVSVVLEIELSVLCMLGNYYQLNHIPKFASVSLVHTQGFFISIFYRVRFRITSYHQLVFVCSPGTKPKAFHKVHKHSGLELLTAPHHVTIFKVRRHIL